MKIYEPLLVASLLITWSPRVAQSQTADAKPTKPEEVIGHVVLQKDIKIPDKKKTGFQRLVGNSEFPFLGKDKIGDNVYYLLVIPDLDGYRRPALVPSYDERSYPSVAEHLDTVVIDNSVGLKAYLGYYPLKAQLKLPVVSLGSGKYVVRYTSYGCDEKLELAESDVIFTSIEQERAQERALEEARQKREREEQLAREKFVAEQKAKGLVEYQGIWMTPQQAAEAEKQRVEAIAQQQRAMAEAQQRQQLAIQQERQNISAWIRTGRYTLPQIKAFLNRVMALKKMAGEDASGFITPDILKEVIGTPNFTSGRDWVWNARVYNPTTETSEDLWFRVNDSGNWFLCDSQGSVSLNW